MEQLIACGEGASMVYAVLKLARLGKGEYLICAVYVKRENLAITICIIASGDAVFFRRLMTYVK